MEIEDVPKGRIKKFEYMAVINGEQYDVYSINKKTKKVNIGYERGTFWADLKDIERLIRYED